MPPTNEKAVMSKDITGFLKSERCMCSGLCSKHKMQIISQKLIFK